MKSDDSNTKPLRILHLEDGSLDIDLFKLQLRSLKRPFSIKHVSTEPDFKSTLERTFVDIIVSDSHLPGFDTCDALAFARQNYPDIPFVFFSGHLSPEVQREALSSGALAFIDKNDSGRLVSTIERLCTGRKLPALGHPVVVQCKGFRCLACLNEKGKWVDLLHGNELPEVISWYDA